MFKIIPAIFLLAFSFSVDAYNIDIGMNFQDGVSKDFNRHVSGYGMSRFHVEGDTPIGNPSIYFLKKKGRVTYGIGLQHIASSSSAKLGRSAKKDMKGHLKNIKLNTLIYENPNLSGNVRDSAKNKIDASEKGIDNINNLHKYSAFRDTLNMKASYNFFGNYDVGLEVQVPIGNVGPMFDDSNNVLAVVGYSSNQLLIDFKSNGDQHQINVGFRLK